MDAILGLITIIALGGLLYGPWQHACTDFARQRIFANRDRLFDLASQGQISFDSRIYQTVRLGLESNIRFAHRLTIPRMIYYRIMLQGRFDEESSASKAIQRIEDENLRSEIYSILRDSQIILIAMALMKSPLFAFLMPMYILAYWNHRLGSMIYRAFAARVGQWADVVQVEAENAPNSALHPI